MEKRVEGDFERPQAPDKTMEELFDELAGPFAGFLGKLHLSPPDIEDVMQDAFLLVHKVGGYRSGKRSPKGWLFEIGRLLSLKHFRRERLAQATFAPAEEGGEVKDEATSPSHLLLRSQIFQETLNELPEEQRACFVMFEVGEFTAEEIAEVEEIKVGTVYSRIRLAREHLERRTALLAARDRAGKVLRTKSAQVAP